MTSELRKEAAEARLRAETVEEELDGVSVAHEELKVTDITNINILSIKNVLKDDLVMVLHSMLRYSSEIARKCHFFNGSIFHSSYFITYGQSKYIFFSS